MADQWRVAILRAPKKMLDRLPPKLRQRMARAIDGLAVDPRPPGCKKLAGHEDLYRVRVGDWRISYALHEAELIVLVVEVAPRGGAYRDP